MERRDVPLFFRLTAAEFKLIRAGAGAAGQPPSTFARDAAIARAREILDAQMTRALEPATEAST